MSIYYKVLPDDFSSFIVSIYMFVIFRKVYIKYKPESSEGTTMQGVKKVRFPTSKVIYQNGCFGCEQLLFMVAVQACRLLPLSFCILATRKNSE